MISPMLSQPVISSSTPTRLTTTRTVIPTAIPVSAVANLRPMTVVQPRVAVATPMTSAASVPVIAPVRIPVTATRTPSFVGPSASLPVVPKPLVTAAPSITSVKPSTVIPNTDAFVIPSLAKRLPAPVKLPTRTAEQAAMPTTSGEKQVVSTDVAPAQSVPSAYAPSRMTSNLNSLVDQNPYDDGSRAAVVEPPQWYKDNYMNEFAAPMNGDSVSTDNSKTTGWVIAAGLGLAAAFLWYKTR